ncbi:HNH endonuclease [Pseudomonas sp. TH34]|uniref:HNH endonuclease n=1 Tax=Pseudomonas sp. TH34 TaxID=2796399 RepID=UPI001913E8CE|nr:HNH endonuclease signature motif containing protein [Pseudomonas sp. TH34]MBK5407415.1 HNH endonuclease [Pseudomonas sp. TH34]
MKAQEKQPNINKHGLQRKIPAGVRREVRKRCGFGCVICGAGIVQYEHVDPEFCDALIHNANNIALLCPSCHGKVTTKFWSKQKVINAMKSPACLQAGFVKDVFDFCQGHPLIEFGGTTFEMCTVPLTIFDRAILRVDPPEEVGAPFRLSAWLTDENGEVTLRVQDNEWEAYTDNWDVEISGGSIVIRSAPGVIVLRVTVLPPDKLVIDRLKMRFGPVGVVVTDNEFALYLNDIPMHSFSGCKAQSLDKFIDLYSLAPGKLPAQNALQEAVRLVNNKTYN